MLAGQRMSAQPGSCGRRFAHSQAGKTASVDAVAARAVAVDIANSAGAFRLSTEELRGAVRGARAGAANAVVILAAHLSLGTLHIARAAGRAGHGRLKARRGDLPADPVWPHGRAIAVDFAVFWHEARAAAGSAAGRDTLERPHRAVFGTVAALGLRTAHRGTLHGRRVDTAAAGKTRRAATFEAGIGDAAGGGVAGRMVESAAPIDCEVRGGSISTASPKVGRATVGKSAVREREARAAARGEGRDQEGEGESSVAHARRLRKPGSSLNPRDFALCAARSLENASKN